MVSGLKMDGILTIGCQSDFGWMQQMVKKLVLALRPNEFFRIVKA